MISRPAGSDCLVSLHVVRIPAVARWIGSFTLSCSDLSASDERQQDKRRREPSMQAHWLRSARLDSDHCS